MKYLELEEQSESYRNSRTHQQVQFIRCLGLFFIKDIWDHFIKENNLIILFFSYIYGSHLKWKHVNIYLNVSK